MSYDSCSNTRDYNRMTHKNHVSAAHLQFEVHKARKMKDDSKIEEDRSAISRLTQTDTKGQRENTIITNVAPMATNVIEANGTEAVEKNRKLHEIIFNTVEPNSDKIEKVFKSKNDLASSSKENVKPSSDATSNKYLESSSEDNVKTSNDATSKKRSKSSSKDKVKSSSEATSKLKPSNDATSKKHSNSSGKEKVEPFCDAATTKDSNSSSKNKVKASCDATSKKHSNSSSKVKVKPSSDAASTKDSNSSSRDKVKPSSDAATKNDSNSSSKGKVKASCDASSKKHSNSSSKEKVKHSSDASSKKHSNSSSKEKVKPSGDATSKKDLNSCSKEKVKPSYDATSKKDSNSCLKEKVKPSSDATSKKDSNSSGKAKVEPFCDAATTKDSNSSSKDKVKASCDATSKKHANSSSKGKVKPSSDAASTKDSNSSSRDKVKPSSDAATKNDSNSSSKDKVKASCDASSKKHSNSSSKEKVKHSSDDTSKKDSNSCLKDKVKPSSDATFKKDSNSSGKAKVEPSCDAATKTDSKSSSKDKVKASCDATSKQHSNSSSVEKVKPSRYAASKKDLKSSSKDKVKPSNDATSKKHSNSSSKEKVKPSSDSTSKKDLHSSSKDKVKPSNDATSKKHSNSSSKEKVKPSSDATSKKDLNSSKDKVKPSNDATSKKDSNSCLKYKVKPSSDAASKKDSNSSGKAKVEPFCDAATTKDSNFSLKDKVKASCDATSKKHSNSSSENKVKPSTDAPSKKDLNSSSKDKVKPSNDATSKKDSNSCLKYKVKPSSDAASKKDSNSSGKAKVEPFCDAATKKDSNSSTTDNVKASCGATSNKDSNSSSENKVKPSTDATSKKDSNSSSKYEVKYVSDATSKKDVDSSANDEVKPFTDATSKKDLNSSSKEKVKPSSDAASKKDLNSSSKDKVKPSNDATSKKDSRSSSKEKVKPSSDATSNKDSNSSSENKVKPSTDAKSKKDSNSFSKEEVKSVSDATSKKDVESSSKDKVKPSRDATSKEDSGCASKDNVIPFSDATSQKCKNSSSNDKGKPSSDAASKKDLNSSSKDKVKPSNDATSKKDSRSSSKEKVKPSSDATSNKDSNSSSENKVKPSTDAKSKKDSNSFSKEEVKSVNATSKKDVESSSKDKVKPSRDATSKEDSGCASKDNVIPFTDATSKKDLNSSSKEKGKPSSDAASKKDLNSSSKDKVKPSNDATSKKDSRFSSKEKVKPSSDATSNKDSNSSSENKVKPSTDAESKKDSNSSSKDEVKSVSDATSKKDVESSSKDKVKPSSDATSKEDSGCASKDNVIPFSDASSQKCKNSSSKDKGKPSSDATSKKDVYTFAEDNVKLSSYATFKKDLNSSSRDKVKPASDATAKRDLDSSSKDKVKPASWLDFDFSAEDIVKLCSYATSKKGSNSSLKDKGKSSILAGRKRHREKSKDKKRIDSVKKHKFDDKEIDIECTLKDFKNTSCVLLKCLPEVENKKCSITLKERKRQVKVKRTSKDSKQLPKVSRRSLNKGCGKKSAKSNCVDLIKLCMRSARASTVAQRPAACKIINNDCGMTEKNTKFCALCNSKPPNLTNHYHCKHKCESYVSRLTWSELDELCSNTPLATLVSGKNSHFYEVLCAFCSSSLVMPFIQLYQHYASHTGEYAYQCASCHLNKPFETDIQSHQSHSKRCCNSTIQSMYTYSSEAMSIYLYYCAICNFVQLNEANVIKHLGEHHDARTRTEENVMMCILAAISEGSESNSLPSEGYELPEPNNAKDVTAVPEVNKSSQEALVIQVQGNEAVDMEESLSLMLPDQTTVQNAHQEPLKCPESIADVTSIDSFIAVCNKAYIGEQMDVVEPLELMHEDYRNDNIPQQELMDFMHMVDEPSTASTITVGKEVSMGNGMDVEEPLRCMHEGQTNDKNARKEPSTVTQSGDSQPVIYPDSLVDEPSVGHTIRDGEDDFIAHRTVVKEPLKLMLADQTIDKSLHPEFMAVMGQALNVGDEPATGHTIRDGKEKFFEYPMHVKEPLRLLHEAQVNNQESPMTVSGIESQLTCPDNEINEIPITHMPIVIKSEPVDKAQPYNESVLHDPPMIVSGSDRHLTCSNNEVDVKPIRHMPIVIKTNPSDFDDFENLIDIQSKKTNYMLKNTASHSVYRLYPKNVSYLGLYKCMADDCFYSSDVSKEFVQHIKGHRFESLPRNILCPYCSISNKTFRSVNKLVEHMKRNHVHMLYQCSMCCYRSCEASYVSIHQKENHLAYLENCVIYKCFAREPNFNIKNVKKKMFEAVTKAKCSHCSASYYSTHLLMLHMTANHNLKEQMIVPRYSCVYCNLWDSSKSEIQRHVSLKHPGELPYLCDHNSNRITEDALGNLELVNFSEPVPTIQASKTCDKLPEQDMIAQTNIEGDIKPWIEELNIRAKLKVKLRKLTEKSGVAPDCLYRCPIQWCGGFFSRYELWLRHMKVKHTCSQTQCPHCLLKPTKLLDEFAQHFQEHCRHTFICFHCPVTAATGQQAQMHWLNEHKDLGEMHVEKIPYNLNYSYTILIQENSFQNEELFFSLNSLMGKRLKDFEVSEASKYKHQWLVPYDDSSALWLEDFQKHAQNLKSVCIMFDPVESAHKIGENFYNCSKCDVRLENESLDEHIKKHTESGFFICCACSQFFNQRFKISEHIRLYHASRDVPIVKLFNDKQLLFAKIAIVFANKRLAFSTIENCFCCMEGNLHGCRLLMHLKMYHNFILHCFCEWCNMPVESLRAAQIHFEKIHTTNKMKIRCEISAKENISIISITEFRLGISSGNDRVLNIKGEAPDDDVVVVEEEAIVVENYERTKRILKENAENLNLECNTCKRLGNSNLEIFEHARMCCRKQHKDFIDRLF